MSVKGKQAKETMEGEKTYQRNVLQIIRDDTRPALLNLLCLLQTFILIPFFCRLGSTIERLRPGLGHKTHVFRRAHPRPEARASLCKHGDNVLDQ